MRATTLMSELEACTLLVATNISDVHQIIDPINITDGSYLKTMHINNGA